MTNRPGFRARSWHVCFLTLALACQWPAANADEADLIAEALRLEPGMTIGDVGAGDGKWTQGLAERVGPTGEVIATEVDVDELDRIRDRIEREGLDNVTVVPGDQQGNGLPDECCDGILLRLVYHHFTDPTSMRSDLRRALKPGGRIVIVELDPQADWSPVPLVPERGGHGIPTEDLVSEMTGDGFIVVDRYEDWSSPDRYCIVFQ